jgi:hypothetical protein
MKDVMAETKTNRKTNQIKKKKAYKEKEKEKENNLRDKCLSQQTKL